MALRYGVDLYAITHSSTFQKKYLKFEDIYKLEISKNTLSILSGRSPEPLHAIFVISQGQHNHGMRHSQAFKIHVPKIRISIANMSIVKNGSFIMEFTEPESVL